INTNGHFVADARLPTSYAGQTGDLIASHGGGGGQLTVIGTFTVNSQGVVHVVGTLPAGNIGTNYWLRF
ncbi:MAG: hypothetical protein ACXV3D_00225, partial [Halobacteriota archaeon]